MATHREQDARHLEAVGAYYQTGDEQLLGPMLADLREQALAYLRGTLRMSDTERAEDLAQEALAKLLDAFRARRYEPTRPPGVLLCVLCLYGYRAAKRAKPSDPSQHEDPFLLVSTTHAIAPDEVRAENEAQAATMVAAATQAVLGLDAGARAAVLLHYYQGLPEAEAAARLGISETAFGARLQRGLAALRQWAATTARPTADVYAALSRLDTGSLFSEPLRLAS
jgi:RNA polymerase sigma factor (sigma-70 family)